MCNFVINSDILCKFVTCNQIEFGPMKLKFIILNLLVCYTLAGFSQPVSKQEQWDWYLEEVVDDAFIGRNYFEYYYTPSAADMEQQRSKGEVTYFLNTPMGLNSKKVRDMIDRLMASYDDIKAVCDWQMTSTTYWKEFRFEKNKFRFSVKRKALDDGTYYVSVTETAGYYKSLGKSTKGKSEQPKTEKNKSEKAKTEKEKTERVKDAPAADKPSKRSTRSRRPITERDIEEADMDDNPVIEPAEEVVADVVPVMTEKERRQAARQREEAAAQEQRLAKRRAQEQQREEAKKKKEAEKQKKAEEKKKKEEEKRLAQEEKRKLREQAQREREQAAQEKAANRKQANTAKSDKSNFHYDNVALWLSEKYDFTQIAAAESSCTMYSTVVKDAEMAKLAIKNALKGSNARMAIPWRVNSETQSIETGYTVDNHVLVFVIGKDADQHVTITVTEVSNEQFELFKQNLNGM